MKIKKENGGNIMAKCKCDCTIGIPYKGEFFELDPCVYETEQILTNCIVCISKCKICGTPSISWKRTADTEDVPETDWELFNI
jgi:hypothetical protein